MPKGGINPRFSRFPKDPQRDVLGIREVRVFLLGKVAVGSGSFETNEASEPGEKEVGPSLSAVARTLI